MTRRASLHTLGCRLNQSETNLIRQRLQAEGYTIVPFGEPADLGIVNTCTVTREADAKSRKALRSFIRQNPTAFVAVIGCYSQMGYQALSEIEGVDLIVGNQEKLNVLEYARHGKNDRPVVIRDRLIRDDFTIDPPGEAPPTQRANLKIQDGCDFMCSFCIIPFARGRARSRDFQNLLEEAEQLVAHGAKELVLTGVNIGSFDSCGKSIVDIVDKVNTIDGLARVRISSIEPTTIPLALFERMADDAHALTPYLHIPVQSGSDRVLARMRRKYTRAEFTAFIEQAAARVPGIGIGTDILVGSPGETDADFEETCALLADGPFAYAHVFKYSERDGTAAQRFEPKVVPQEKNRRSARVRLLSDRKLAGFHAQHTGQPASVLFETAENGVWSGYTGNYIRVAARSNAILANEMCEVILDRTCGDFMVGRLAHEPAEVVA